MALVHREVGWSRAGHGWSRSFIIGPSILEAQTDLARPPKVLPNRIRELREAKGLTLEDVARRVGTTNQQISHLELGKRELTVDWLRRLGAALGCHPWAVVEELPEELGSPD